MKIGWAGVVFAGLLGAGRLQGQSAGSAEVRFHFERPGMPVPQFTIVIPREGSGRYEAEVEQEPVGNSASGSGRASGVRVEGSPVARNVVETMALQPETVERIFRGAATLENFRVACASKAKNIADTGVKTLSYRGPEGTGSCTYNYAENKSVLMLTDLFLGMAVTMDEGRSLAFEHRYDRLGLDAELETLKQAVEDKRAVEVGLIAPVLRGIIADTELMQRARERAARLLDGAGLSR